MNGLELYEFLKPKPFHPVRFYLKDGRTYDVHFRQLIVVGMDFIKLGIPAPGERGLICSDIVEVDLDQVDRVVRLEGALSSPAR